MLIARSAQEAHLYMDLHVCVCGASEFERAHHLEDREGDLVAVYEGVCAQCGRARSFEFRMSEELPPAPPAFGHDEPSRIIDPGEFVWAGDQASAESGLRLLNTPIAEHRSLRPQVAYAIAAFEEAAKFLPEGADRIPEERFTSELGRELYAKDPSRFTRARIESALERKRAILADLDRLSPPSG